MSPPPTFATPGPVPRPSGGDARAWRRQQETVLGLRDPEHAAMPWRGAWRVGLGLLLMAQLAGALCWGRAALSAAPAHGLASTLALVDLLLSMCGGPWLIGSGGQLLATAIREARASSRLRARLTSPALARESADRLVAEAAFWAAATGGQGAGPSGNLAGHLAWIALQPPVEASCAWAAVAESLAAAYAAEPGNADGRPSLSATEICTQVSRVLGASSVLRGWADGWTAELWMAVATRFPQAWVGAWGAWRDTVPLVERRALAALLLRDGARATRLEVLRWLGTAPTDVELAHRLPA